MIENELGKPMYWNLQTHVSSVKQMAKADELIIALEMCDKIPAWYLEPENYPKELTEIKNTIYRQLYDPCTYGCDDEEADMTIETARAQAKNGYMFPRFDITAARVKELNQSGIYPWIYELGCSHGNLVVGMMNEGLRFNYLGRGINWRIVNKVKGWAETIWKEQPDPGQYTMFVCFESLEHMLNEQDLEAGAKKVGVDFDEILLSVPYGCLGGGLPEYDNRPIGHVRGYNRKSFFQVADKFFPNRSWELTISHSMVLAGRK